MSSIADQFKGLPIGELIANPLIAAAQAQGKLAGITKDFIEEVGLQNTESDPDKDPVLKARTVDFAYDAIVEEKQTNGETVTKVEPRKMQVPLLSIVNTPNLSVKNVKIDFDMKVQSSSEHKDSTSVKVDTSVKYAAWWSPVSASMTASVANKSENTRKSDNSARYTVHCEARDDGAPEGLMKVLDILGDAIKPTGPTVANTNSGNSGNSGGSGSNNP
tara:strand:- start:1666 stop:2319 length:654 start_codon:yes stop_codon:yes gene_type:complete